MSILSRTRCSRKQYYRYRLISSTVRDTSAVAFGWSLEVDGVETAAGTLDVPVLASGESAVVTLPAETDAGADFQAFRRDETMRCG